MEKNKYNCIIIDDEYLARKLIADYVSKIHHLNLAGCFDSPINAIDTITNGSIDVIFTDIEMSDMTGIDFIKNLSIHNRPIVVFITAYPQYAVQGFEIDAVEYLLKPVSFPRFVKAVNKVTNILKIRDQLISFRNNKWQSEDVSSDKDYIIVKTERRIVKLLYSEIYFIEGALEYVTFQTVNRRIMGLFSLKKLEEELPGDRFMRIHKSYIVALDKISEIKGNQVQVGQWTINVSKAMKSKLLKSFGS